MTLMFGTERRRFGVGKRRHFHPRQLIAVEARDPDIVERIVARKAPVADIVSNAKAAADFHRADADLHNARRPRPVVILLDQRAGNPREPRSDVKA